MNRKKSLNLIHDEVVQLKAGNFRMQVWRAKHLAPVVLFVQLPGEPQPKFFVGRLTQIAVEQYLGYSAIPLVFCYAIARKTRQAEATKVIFEVIGSPHRPIVGAPKMSSVDPEVIAGVFHLCPA